MLSVSEANKTTNKVPVGWIKRSGSTVINSGPTCTALSTVLFRLSGDLLLFLQQKRSKQEINLTGSNLNKLCLGRRLEGRTPGIVPFPPLARKQQRVPENAMKRYFALGKFID